MVFNAYASYYDLMYRDKEYSSEAVYVSNLLRNHSPKVESILELGCGTGAHAELLTRMGYTVHGIDMSADMLARAERRKATLPAEISSKLSFDIGDARTIRTGGTYSAVISLFHVMSYQATNADLSAAFQTAAKHLKPGGVFLFDCWYGPAVLTDRPVVRVKRIQDDIVDVLRIAEPVIYPNESVVDVNYTVQVKQKGNADITELKETHRMRYLFAPELESLLGKAGMRLVKFEEWMTSKPASFDTWLVTFIAVREH